MGFSGFITVLGFSIKVYDLSLQLHEQLDISWFILPYYLLNLLICHLLRSKKMHFIQVSYYGFLLEIKEILTAFFNLLSFQAWIMPLAVLTLRGEDS